MCNQRIIWQWEPLISIGYIRFNEPIIPLIRKYKLQRKVEYEPPDWQVYEFPEDETLVNVEKSRVLSVSCYNNFFYKGKNLLGISLKEINDILGKEYEIDESIETQTLVIYDSMSLQLWFENGVTVSAMCYGFIEENFDD